MTAASNVKGSMPPDTGMRIGSASVDANGLVSVFVSGKRINCGYLDPGGIVDASAVALLRGEDSWLALGATAAQPTQRVTSTAMATADLALTTVAQAITGVSVTVLAATTTPYFATLSMDVDITAAAATVAIGQLVLDGVTITSPQALFSSVSSVARATVFQQWNGTLDAGSHTFTVTARKNNNVGTLAIQDLNTVLTVRLGG